VSPRSFLRWKADRKADTARNSRWPRGKSDEKVHAHHIHSFRRIPQLKRYFSKDPNPEALLYDLSFTLIHTFGHTCQKCNQINSNRELRTGGLVMTTTLILTGLIWICQNCQLRAIAIDTRVCDTSTLVLRVAEEPSFFSCCITLRSVCGLTESSSSPHPAILLLRFLGMLPTNRLGWWEATTWNNCSRAHYLRMRPLHGQPLWTHRAVRLNVIQEFIKIVIFKTLHFTEF